MALALALSLVPAFAHEGEEEPAKTLVQKAIALLRSQPDERDAIMDMMHDALESEETKGVDLDLVEQADAAYEDGKVHEAWDLLEEAIGAEPHRIATGPGDVTGSEPSEVVASEETDERHVDAPEAIIHERELAGGPRWPTSGTNWTLLVAAGALLFAGGVIVGKVH